MPPADSTQASAPDCVLPVDAATVVLARNQTPMVRKKFGPRRNLCVPAPAGAVYRRTRPATRSAVRHSRAHRPAVPTSIGTGQFLLVANARPAGPAEAHTV